MRRAALPTLAIVAVVAVLVWLVGGLLEVLLLVFAGVLLGLCLNGAGGWVATRLGLPRRACVAAICLGLAGIVALAIWGAAPAVSVQVDELRRSLPKAFDRGATVLDRYEWGRALVERSRHLGDLLGRRETLSRAGGILSSTFGALGGFLVFLFIGLFVAFEAELYRRGLIRLMPLRVRNRAGEVLGETAHALRMWMAGKLFAMLVVGLSTWLGLVLLGVPLGLTLALLAAVLTFIPNFGPVLAAVPAVLLGLIDGPSKALYVGLLYIGVQTVESYVLTPLVQKKTVSLPPALGIVGQLIMGALAGGLGILVATPLTVAALVLVKEVYVRDLLGDADEDSSTDEGAKHAAVSAGSSEEHSTLPPGGADRLRGAGFGRS